MKKLLLILLITALILCMVGCETTANAEEEKQFTRGNDYLTITVDKETGVNYIVYNSINEGGIIPRYNPDGTLYVSEVE